MHINIYMRPSGEIESGVIDGRYHVGVVPAVARHEALEYRHLYAETAYLYGAADHPLAAAGAKPSRQAIAAADAVQPAYALPPDGQRCHAGLKATATATDREGIAFLVLTGCFIGFLPEHFARRWVDGGRLRPLCVADIGYRIDYAAITPARPTAAPDTGNVPRRDQQHAQEWDA